MTLSVFLHNGMICPLEIVYALPWLTMGYFWLRMKLKNRKCVEKLECNHEEESHES